MLENHPLLKRGLVIMAVAISAGFVISLLSFFVEYYFCFGAEHERLVNNISTGLAAFAAVVTLKILDARKKKKP